MKKLFDIPAYAVVELSGKRPQVVSLCYTRDDARKDLQEFKFQTDGEFKIVKLEASKFVR